MDAAVAAMFQDKNKRKDLFNMWLTHACDFGKCALEISRVNIQGRRFTGQVTAGKFWEVYP